MSQSDYIKYKRLQQELSNQRKNLAPVINSSQYIGYKSFDMENTITNSKLSYVKLQPAGSVNVFGMQINNPSSGACLFNFCKGTDSRVNRKPLSGTQIYSHPLKIPLKPKTIEDLIVCKHC